MNPLVTISPKADEELESILTYLEANFGVLATANCLDEIEKICWDIAVLLFAFPSYKRKSVRNSN